MNAIMSPGPQVTIAGTSAMLRSCVLLHQRSFMSKEKPWISCIKQRSTIGLGVRIDGSPTHLLIFSVIQNLLASQSTSAPSLLRKMLYTLAGTPIDLFVQSPWLWCTHKHNDSNMPQTEGPSSFLSVMLQFHELQQRSERERREIEQRELRHC